MRAIFIDHLAIVAQLVTCCMCLPHKDAIQSYEAIMATESAPDAQTGFNLIVCYYALGDRDKMKKGFQMLLGVQEYADDDEDEDDEMKEVKEELGLRQDELKKDKFDR
jgi:intraflagellar transport protein 88